MASFCNFSSRTVCQSILFTLKVKPSSHDAMVANAHADPKRVAVKLMRWSWELSDEQRGLPVRGTQTGGLTSQPAVHPLAVDALEVGPRLDADHLRQYAQADRVR